MSFLRHTACLVVAVAQLSGCASISWNPLARRSHAQAYQRALEEQTQAALPEGATLGLEDCVGLALQHNLRVRSAAIRARIAQLDRETAFANFLPAVELTHTAVGWDQQPENVMFGMLSSPIHDQRMYDMAVEMQLPIFVPATWYLYAMRKRGEEIGQLVENYTRQMIVLQVTALYFHCLALDETAKSLESQIAAAQTLERELGMFRAEGLVSQWQAEQGAALALARTTMLEQTRRSRRQVGAQLMTVLGLSPLTEVTLQGDRPIGVAERPLEEWVAQALLGNPRLHIADRQAAIQREQVNLALAEFLPKLAGFASFNHTSDSFVKYPDFWMYGLSGVMSIFNGFANVNEYRAAREREEDAFLQREEQCLTVMLEVIQAYYNVKNARSGVALSEKLFSVASGRATEVEAQWREGLVSPSDRLAVLADRDRAQMERINAAFQEQVAMASLLNVAGAGYAGHEVPDYEKAD